MCWHFKVHDRLEMTIKIDYDLQSTKIFTKKKMNGYFTFTFFKDFIDDF